MCKIFLWFIALVSIVQIVRPQSGPILNAYIKQGLENNLALQQKNLDLEKSLQSLKEANGLFYPSAGLDAQYILSNGGRSISLPVGDMLNPVYSSLNQILQNMGQQGGFPQINNEKIQFLPNNYHDTKIRVIMPLVNAEIYYNRKIKKELINYSRAEVNVYKRELVKDIKTAYMRYLQAIKVIEAYNSAQELVYEALRVNEKLVKNQMAGNEKLFRIRAELGQVEAQLLKAENDKKMAIAYFNFLINQSLQTPVTVDSFLLNSNEITENSKKASDIQNREEIALLNSAVKSSEFYLQLRKSHFIPTISNITDLGYQGYDYKFNNEQRYVMNSISFQWAIFNGFQNRSRTAQAKIENNALQKKLSEVEQQIALQKQLSEDNLESSLKTEKANQRSLISSKEYYKVISKQYAEGQKSLLDLLDARNQLTNTQINYDISHFESLIKFAELERATAGYNID